MKFLRKEKGFTLIELLVVIAIIGVLASIALSSLNTARAKARDIKRLAEVKNLQKALEIYYLDNNRYPQGYNPPAANCLGSSLNSNWDSLMSSLDITIEIDKSWPLCIYYFTGPYHACNEILNAEYTIILGTESGIYQNLDEYNIQGENNSQARYCLYPLG